MASSFGVSLQDQKTSFHERLRRIEKGARYTSQHVYCGPVEEVADLQNGGKSRTYIPRQHGLVTRAFKALVTRLVAAPAAVAIGVIAVIGARVLRVSFFGGTLAGENAMQMFAYDVGIAAVLAFVIRALFRFRGSFQWATALAMAVTLVMMHNFVHTNPDLFTTLFTVDWVQSVLSETREGTLMVAGNTIRF